MGRIPTGQFGQDDISATVFSACSRITPHLFCRARAMILSLLVSAILVGLNLSLLSPADAHESTRVEDVILREANRDDRLPDMIPDRPGVYVWSHEAPALFESLLGMLLDTQSKEELDDYLADLHSDAEEVTNEASGDSLNSRFAIEAVQQLANGFFDSELLYCLTLSEGGVSQRSLIAHSSRPKKEIEQFMNGLAALLNAPSDGVPADSSVSVKAPAFWRFENGWLIWSDTENELKLIFESLSTPPARSLSANRSFERLFAGTRSTPETTATLSLFVSDEVLRSYLLSHNPLPELFNVRPQDEPERAYFAAYLNEIRALGGRVLFFKETESAKPYRSLAFDLSTLVTEPRHGVLGAIEHRKGLRFDLPLIDRPLESLFQVEVDGNRLAKGIEDTNTRLAAFSKFTFPFGNPSPSDLFLGWHSLDKFDGPSSPQVLRHANRFLSMKYANSDDSDRWRLQVWSALELNDRERVDDLITDALNEDQLGSWAIKDEGDLTCWSISSDGAGKLKEGLEKEMQARKESGRIEFDAPVRLTLRMNAGQIKQGGDGGFVIDMNDLFSQMIEQYRERLSKYLDQAYIAIDDWLFVRPLAKNDLADFTKGDLLGDSTQLLDLRSSVDRISRDFDVRPCGLIVNWSTHLQQKLSAVLPSMTRATANPSQIDASADDRQMREHSILQDWQDQRQAIVESLEKLVVLIEKSPSGFRLVARLDRREASVSGKLEKSVE